MLLASAFGLLSALALLTFASSFLPYEGNHRSDEIFGIVLVAGISLMFAMFALGVGAVQFVKERWDERWAWLPLGVVVLDLIRIMHAMTS